MNTELIKVLSDFGDCVKDYCLKVIPTEEEFIDKLVILNQRLASEIKNAKLPDVDDR